MDSIPYKSFCWGLGTTSFRTKNFNKTIEEQLALLDEFWQTDDNAKYSWAGNNELQTKYYDFMLEKEFVKGEANNKPKDAREKTSGLVDIGLISDDRRITEAGRALLAVSQSGDFSSDNALQIDKDSFIYFKQLIKTYNKVNGATVRPFIVMLYVLSKLDYLSLDEYTYLLPLCTDLQNTDRIIREIQAFRNSQITIDEIIIERLLTMDNYQQALQMLQEKAVTEEVICNIGMNRKSRNYDKTYFPLYQHLFDLYMNHNYDCALQVYTDTKAIKIGRLWRSYLFDTVSKVQIEREPNAHLNRTLFDNINNVAEFKNAFFKVMHLLKAKATLSDYLDLNRRYIKTTEVVIFEDNQVKLDIIPKQYFKPIIEELYGTAYEECDCLFADCSIERINPVLAINETAIISGINEEYETHITTISDVYRFVSEDRYQRFHQLIDDKFTDEKLLDLLEHFENRNDDEIHRMVTDNADIPTIFEYVLGIIWYKVSEMQGDILNYMKLSRDADLLPVTHAGGGEADLVYEYSETADYPEHSLLIEATLASDTNQRRMEMEPVSRHLGRHLIRTGNMNSYCVFITPYLDINVISDFRSRKNTPYYDTQDTTRFVDGMKIIPLNTDTLKAIIHRHLLYRSLYGVFETAYQSNLPPHQWYEDCLSSNI